MPAPTRPEALKLYFKGATATTASWDTLKKLAGTSRLNEAETVYSARARVRDEILPSGDEGTLFPLTKPQHRAIADMSPGAKEVRDSLL